MSLSIAVAGDGPDLVLLHGWGAHGGVWGEVIERLAQHFRVHVVDLPGHGRSPPGAQGALRGLADHLASVFPRAVGVAGWSLGGQVAIEWALAAPGHVRGLALLASTPCFVERTDWAHGMQAEIFDAFAQELERDGPATLARFAALQVLGSAHAQSTRATLRRWLSQARAPAPADLAEGLQLLRATDLRARLGAVQAKCVVIHGTQDRIAPLAAGAFLAAALPCARFEAVDGAGHVPFLSHPETCVQIIRGLADD
jgi:pimeloyl-[acyl-carrier protein] methyl ester esterase